MKKYIRKNKNEVIEIYDLRFYCTSDGRFYPSVTTILDVFPKGYGYIDWLKSVGFNAEIVSDRAMEKGSRIHNAIENLIFNGELSMYDENDNKIYEIDEWEQILRFVEFYDKYVEIIYEYEADYVSKRLKTGGTIDLVCRLNDGKEYVVDFKTGNALYKTNEIQISVYKEMLYKKFPNAIPALLHLNARTRGERSGKIQGEGWKLLTISDTEHKKNIQLFKHTYQIWRSLNPNYKPKNLSYTTKIKIKNKLI